MSVVGGAGPLDAAAMNRYRPSTGSVRSAMTVSVPEFKVTNDPNIPMPTSDAIDDAASGERIVVRPIVVVEVRVDRGDDACPAEIPG